MGGGDLNLKKSWHPSLLRNQERVWSEEKKALDERKRIDQLRRERDEERQIQDLQRLHEDSGKPRAQNRVDWMYQAPSGDGTGGGYVAEEMEGYLLGKRRIDGILLRNEKEGNSAVGVEAITSGQAQQAVPGAGAVNSRDTMAKIMADPLFEVKKREQAAYEAMVKESARRGKKPVFANGDGRDGERREKHRGRERDHERDRDSRHRRRRHSENRYRSRRHRSATRSRSPLSPEHHRSHRSRRDERRDDHDRRDRDRRDHGRRDDRSRERDSRRDRDERRYRSSSRHRDSRDRDDRHYDRSPRQGSYHRRSPSPRREGNGYRKLRDYDNRRGSYRRDRSRDRASNGTTKPSPPNQNGNDGTNAKSLEEDRARRLAEMQSNAMDLEENRRHRIAHVSAVEEQQRQEDDKHRSERGRFVSGLHRQLQGESLNERIQRSKGGLAVERDD